MSIGNNAKRWERLEALGIKRESVKRDIPTPDGEPKMSAVLLKLAEPLIQRPGTTARQAESIIALTVVAWNKSLLPPGSQPELEKEIVDAFVPQDGYAEDVGTVVEVMELIAERRARLFPDIRKFVVDYELSFPPGTLTLNVTSAPVPNPLDAGGDAVDSHR
ncbi:MAG TPA: hypothetical protein VMV10_03775 [Pirellulales bacterium]|nr:hypothetical protein [Pirellulales bacterium]